MASSAKRKAAYTKRAPVGSPALADRLREYGARRSFGKTPEPVPSAKRPKELPAELFMVHKHDARRLHYDLRLAGDSLIWDRGTYETDPPGQASEMRKQGHLRLVLHGQKLQGSWHLVRMRPRGGKPQWLLFKAVDAAASPTFDVVAARPESVKSGRRVTRSPRRATTRKRPHPAPIDLLVKIWPPMQAVLSTAEAVDDHDVLEVKYDGYRALAAISGSRVALQTRNGLDLSVRFPAIARAVGELAVSEAVLDGEIASERSGERSRFEALQNLTPGALYYVFDLL